MKKFFIGMVLLLSVGLVACGSAESGELEVLNVWGRPSPIELSTSAFYMEIVNGTDTAVSLTKVQTTACQTTELHTMTMQDDVMVMQPVEGQKLTIPAQDTIQLQPGGLHVMCFGKTDPFTIGDEITLNLSFDSGTVMEVVAVIQDGG